MRRFPAPDLQTGKNNGQGWIHTIVTLASVPEYDPSAVPEVGSHAVVVGGSMAGLLAARVLADGYERVTVLERDPMSDRSVARRGVPQAEHVHVMLEAGRAVLADLFPGYQDELVSAGGIVIDAGRKLQYYDRGDYLADSTDPLWMCCASRPLYEQVTRRRVAEIDGITVRDECHFRGYLTPEADTRVDGVEFTDESGEDTTLEANLVVDATGRSSRTHRWLAERGYSAPPVETVDVDLAYSTVTVERPDDDTRAYLCAPSPPDTCGGTAVPVEDDRWIVTLFGMHGTRPPTDREGFLAFAENLAVPEIHEILRTRPWTTGEVSHYPFPANQWRHYEQLAAFPDGLVVTGDAIASFNPIYGQGMSVAALDALQLHHALVDGEQDLATRFFDRASEHIESVWRLAVGADFEFPQTEGPKPLGTDLLNRYTSRLVETAHGDPQVATAFVRVLRLETEPTTLFHPRIVGRVLLPFS